MLVVISVSIPYMLFINEKVWFYTNHSESNIDFTNFMRVYKKFPSVDLRAYKNLFL